MAAPVATVQKSGLWNRNFLKNKERQILNDFWRVKSLRDGNEVFILLYSFTIQPSYRATL